ncbi:glycosyltransferase [Candidatus Micrarchaeota archaeon]|nr:glycosyltransferase [Candidatus Micrarchaeota archaeon]
MDKAEDDFGNVVAIVPALNEENGIARVITPLKSMGVGAVVVVDGNSTDRTVEVAEKLGAKVILQQGRGKGMAFQTFLLRHPIDSSKFYVMLDADGSYSPAELGSFVAALRDCDVATGARPVFIHSLRSLFHVIGGSLISLLGSALYLHYNPDICTGYWGFRGSALVALAPAITAKGFDLEADLFSQSAKKGLKMRLVPISYSKRVGKSKLSFPDGLKIVTRLLQDRL